MPVASEIRVSIDIGSRLHSVALGLSNGDILDEFEMEHNSEGFMKFFKTLSHYEQRHQLPVSVAMEGYNGHARPLDRMIQLRDYRLFNVNNLKLTRFKEIFPGAAKTDALDARKGLELFQLRDHLPLAKEVLQEINPISSTNEQLKRLTRRRRRLVNERVRVINNLHADMQATCPGLTEITQDINQVWYLNFLARSQGDLKKLATQTKNDLLSIKRLGECLVQRIITWQPTAFFSDDVDIVGEFILGQV